MDLDIEVILKRSYNITKGLITALIVAVIALIVTNLAWVWLWNQYDYIETTEYTIEQDGEGFNLIEGSFNGKEQYGTESHCEENEETHP